MNLPGYTLRAIAADTVEVTTTELGAVDLPLELIHKAVRFHRDEKIAWDYFQKMYDTATRECAEWRAARPSGRARQQHNEDYRRGWNDAIDMATARLRENDIEWLSKMRAELLAEHLVGLKED